MDEDSVSFQMFLILLSLIKFCFRKPNFCVQAMSEQYLDVCCCCFSVWGSMRRSQNLEIQLKKKLHKALRSVQFLASSLAFIFKYYPILRVVQR